MPVATGYEMRCPTFQVRLFGIVFGDVLQVENGEQPLIQVACRDCKRLFQKRDSSVFRVYHYYDTTGRITKTEVLRKDDSE